MKKYTAKEIETIIESDIQNNIYKPHEKLPTERELMETYNVSRTTIRTIIDQLIIKRLAYRVPDKGVFVEKEIIRKANRITGFTDMIKDTGSVPSTEVPSVKHIIPNETIREAMKLNEDETVLEVVRKRSVDGDPFLYEVVFINTALFPDIEKYDFSKESLYDIIVNKYHKKIYYLQEVVTATPVDGEISNFLYQKNSGFSLKVEGVSYTYKNEVIEYGISYYHTERFSFESILLNQE